MFPTTALVSCLDYRTSRHERPRVDVLTIRVIIVILQVYRYHLASEHSNSLAQRELKPKASPRTPGEGQAPFQPGVYPFPRLCCLFQVRKWVPCELPSRLPHFTSCA